MSWLLLLSIVAACLALDVTAASPSTGSDVKKEVIIQMFQWDWDSIGEECAEFIGPAGYGFVQGKYTFLIPLFKFKASSIMALST